MSIKDFNKQTVSNLTFEAAVRPIAPTISGYSISGSDDTALDPAGGQTILVNGSGFRPGATITMNNVSISVVTFLSVDQLSFTSPAMSAGTYNLFVVNTDNGAAILAPGIVYSSFPTWTTAQGTLGSYYETQSISETVEATGDAPITYTLVSGSLPSGATLASDGTITGTSPIDNSSTTYSFTIRADDAELQSSTREFSLTINTDVVTWVTPTSGATINLDGSAYSQALSATDAAGYSVSYTANALPTGLTLDSGTISGTSTTEGTTTTLLTATAATTNRTATNTITWVVALGDIYWKYVSLLLSGSTPTTTFINDASLNNAQLTIAGDTRPNNFNPYTEGYYSMSNNGADATATVGSGSTAFNLTGDFTVEAWVYPTVLLAYDFGIIDARTAGAQATPWLLNLANNSGYKIGFYGGQYNNGATTVPVNAWSHVCFTRSGSVLRGFLNGKLDYYNGSYGSGALSPGSTIPVIGTKDTGIAGYDTPGYISNLRLVNGTTVYTTSATTVGTQVFTPPTTPLSVVANTTLLACQSSRHVDNSNNNFSIVPSDYAKIQVSSANPFSAPTTAAYNTQYSTYFDGAGDYLTLPSNQSAFTMGTGDFTVEMWVYTSSLAVGQTFYDTMNGGDSGGSGRFAMQLSTGGTVQLFTGAGSIFTSGGTLAINTWYHIAYSRISNSGKLYVNGNQVNTTYTDNNNYVVGTSSRPIIGINAYDSSTNPMLGSISNLRVVKGVGVYTGSFTPPASPLTATQDAGTNIAAIAGTSTSLLTCQDATLKDNSTNNFTISSVNQPKPIAVSPFTMTTSNTTVTSLGSTYFDGTGDYLSAPSISGQLGAGDFTIEYWWNSGVNTSSAYATQLSMGITSSPLAGAWSCGTRFNTTSAIWFAYHNGTSFTDVQSSASVNDGAWHHLAFSRQSNTLRLFVDGVQRTSATVSQSLGTSESLLMGYNSRNTAYIFGYVSDLRIIKGTAQYTSNFLPPQAPLTPVTNTQLLTCQYNGGANNNGFVDQSSFNNIITRSGNTTQGTFSPFSQTGWSNYFDGNGDYLSSAANASFAFGTGDFTIEAWINYTGTLSGALVPIIQSDAITSSTNNKWFFAFTDINLYFNTHASGGFTNKITFTPSVGVWYHVAVTRTSGTMKMFLNGESKTVTTTGTPSGYSLSQNGITVGGMSTPYYMTGYISNLRMITGTSLYTSSFTPSTTPLTSVSGTSILTCQDNRLIDKSANNFTITKAGDVSVQAFSPFGGVTSVPTSYSTKFDGTSGSYFTFTGKTSLALGSGDFTIESWVYRNFTSGAGGGADAWYTGTRSPTASGGLGIKITDEGRIAWNTSSSYGTGTTTIPAYTWTHIAVVRSSGTLKWYINGVLDYSTSLSQNFSNPTVAIGITDDPYYSRLSVSNFRLVTGTALYNDNFTPPTSPLTEVSNTALLTCQNNILQDNSASPATVTQYGTGQSQITFNPFGTTTTTNVSYTPSVNGGSMYFDGTGDKLTIANYPNLAFGANALTIQCWFYTNAASTEQTIMTNGWASYAPWLIRLNTSNQIVLNMSLNGGNWHVNEAVFGTVTTKQWYHVAVTRSSGGTLRAFLNGVQGYTTELGTSALYNGSQALTVGGRSDTSVPLNGYISDAQLINGSSLYSSTFYPGSAPATPTAGTTLLLNGTSGGIIDYHGTNNLETVGNTQLASEDPYGGSYYSNYFTGSSSYLTVAPNAGLALSFDYTIECWVYFTALGQQGFYSSIDNSGDTWQGPHLEMYTNYAPRLLCYTAGGTAVVDLVHQTTMTTGRWYHIAAVRISNATYIYLDGIRSNTSSSDSTSYVQSGATIGQSYPGSSQNFFGYISNLRVVKGTGLYSGATVSVPTSPLTAVANTQLLTCQSNKFIDNSTNSLVITASTTASVKSRNPFQNNTGKSLYFDGATGKGVIKSNPGLYLNSDFTIEGWVYWTGAATSYQNFIGSNSASFTGNASFFRVWGSNAGGTLGAKVGIGNPTHDGISSVYSTNSLVTNQWNYVTATRSSGVIRVFINGNLEKTGSTDTSPYDFSDNGTVVGDSPWDGAAGWFSGYIKDLRITKGVARYTSTFTPPTTPLKDK